MNVDQDADRRGCAERLACLPPLLFRERVDHLERFVPGADCEERIDLAEERPLPVAVSDSTSVCEAFSNDVDGLVVPVHLGQGVGEVVRGSKSRGRLVVLEGDGEAEPHDGESLLLAAARRQQHPLRRQRLREHLRERERFGDVQRRLDPLRCQLVLAGEEHEPAELGGERGEIVVRLLEGEELERAVHDLQPLLEPATVPHDLREPGGHARGRVGRARPLEECDRLLVVRGRLCPGALRRAP